MEATRALVACKRTFNHLLTCLFFYLSIFFCLKHTTLHHISLNLTLNVFFPKVHVLPLSVKPLDFSEISVTINGKMGFSFTHFRPNLLPRKQTVRFNLVLCKSVSMNYIFYFNSQSSVAAQKELTSAPRSTKQNVVVSRSSRTSSSCALGCS